MPCRSCRDSCRTTWRSSRPRPPCWPAITTPRAARSRCCACRACPRRRARRPAAGAGALPWRRAWEVRPARKVSSATSPALWTSRSACSAAPPAGAALLPLPAGATGGRAAAAALPRAHSATAPRAPSWCGRAARPGAADWTAAGGRRGSCRRRRRPSRRCTPHLGGVRRPDAEPRRARRDRLRQGVLHRPGSHRARPLPRPRQAPPAALHRWRGAGTAARRCRQLRRRPRIQGAERPGGQTGGASFWGSPRRWRRPGRRSCPRRQQHHGHAAAAALALPA